MEKKLVVVLGLLVVAVISSAVFIRPNKQTNKSLATQQEQLNPVAKVEDNKDACVLFTLDEAKKVFSGHDITQTGTVQNFQNDNATSSDCRYAASVQDPNKAITVQVMVQTSNNQLAKSNFVGAKTKAAENVESVGQVAYWDPDMLKLNVLNNDKWILVSVGGAAIDSKELNYAKQIAASIL